MDIWEPVGSDEFRVGDYIFWESAYKILPATREGSYAVVTKRELHSVQFVMWLDIPIGALLSYDEGQL